MPERKRLKILLFVLLACFLLFAAKFGEGAIKNSFHSFFSPVEKYFAKAGDAASNFFSGLFEAKNIKRENGRLLSHNFLLLKEINDLKTLKEENRILKEAVAVASEKKLELMSVEVISKEAKGDLILISGGKNNGIFEGMAVITPAGVLVGKIKQSFADFSEASLISFKNNAFDISIQAEEEVLAVAKGKGYLGLEFQLAPKEKNIKKGDKIFTVALGGNFPKGLLVGEVEEIKKNDAERFQYGIIKPYFEKLPLRNAFVVKNFKPTQ